MFLVKKEKTLTGRIYDFCRQMVIKIYSLSTCIIVEKKKKMQKNPTLGFGTQVIKTWYWYDWLNEVQEYCGKSERI
jgi:hypothetical protein